MVLRKWDPFSDMQRMHQAMDRMWGGGYNQGGEPEMERWAVPLDVIEQGEDILVEASLPGVSPEEIDVSIEDNLLTIKGSTNSEEERNDGKYLIRERRFGAFHRSLRLPNTVDTDRAEPRYENGVLTIVLPKAESKKAKQLQVRTGKAIEGESR